MISISGEEKWVIAFMDYASRVMTCFGVFDEATTENTIKLRMDSGSMAYQMKY